MAISYNKLFKLLIDKGMRKKELCEIADISTASVTKLVNGSNVNTEILEKICIALSCDIGDIAEIIDDKKEGFDNEQ